MFQFFVDYIYNILKYTKHSDKYSDLEKLKQIRTEILNNLIFPTLLYYFKNIFKFLAVYTCQFCNRLGHRKSLV